MADAKEKRAEDSKVMKVVKVLKELEEKYKKVIKDKTAICDFLKSLFPPEYYSKLSIDVAGTADLHTLEETYKQLKDQKRKLKAEKAAAHESQLAALRQRLQTSEEQTAKQAQNEATLRSQLQHLELRLKTEEKQRQTVDAERASVEASALLAKMKRSTSGPQPEERTKKSEALRAKRREDEELILKLSAELNKAQSQLLQQRAAVVLKLEQTTQTESAAPVDGVESPAHLKAANAQLQETLSVRGSRFHPPPLVGKRTAGAAGSGDHKAEGIRSRAEATADPEPTSAARILIHPGEEHPGDCPGQDRGLTRRLCLPYIEVAGRRQGC